MTTQTASTLFLEVAPDWVLALDPDGGLYDFIYTFFKCFIYQDRYQLIVTGLKNTLSLTFFALLLGVALGVVVALIRVSWDKNANEMSGIPKFILKIANFICKLYLTVIRGTPVVVQLLIMYFVIFASSRNKIFVGSLTFGINSGAYVAEIIRGGIMSVDNGQMEAGRSLGFGYVPTMRYIILPQAFRTVLPSLANEFIVLLKETAVCGYIGLSDLTYAANIIGGNTYEYLFPLLAVAMIYLTMVIFFSMLVNKLEVRLREGKKSKPEKKEVL